MEDIKIKQFVKKYWKTILFFVLAGLIGGFATGLYVLDSYPLEVKNELISEINKLGVEGITPHILLALITSFQAAGYGLICGVLGIIISKKIGLWNDEINISKKPLIISLIISLCGGLLLILPDNLIINNLEEVIKNSYNSKPTLVYIVGSILYGGVIEEVLLRLFFMSLCAFVLFKICERKKEKPSNKILIISNIVASLLFALGHLPATLSMFGNSLPIIIRCILLNGAFGLIFGFVYRKYGLRYSMICHAGCHIVSKLIWILFI